jgi:hypothetical protein
MMHGCRSCVAEPLRFKTNRHTDDADKTDVHGFFPLAVVRATTYHNKVRSQGGCHQSPNSSVHVYVIVRKG